MPVRSTRRALVTGAASGIGAAVAHRLALAGMAVVCADVDVDGAGRVAAETGGDPLELDLRSVPDDLGDRLGYLDVLVSCAGVADSTPTSDLDVAGYRRVMEINLDGTVAVTLAVLPLLRAAASGRVLTISSVQGFRAAADTLAYATSKGALVTFTRALAVDVAEDGVLVNALAPGFVDTPMARMPDGTREYDTPWFRSVYVEHARIPMRRPGTADEVAAAAEFFVSPTNTYVTGQVLAVDGGLMATF
ncbi:short-chain dehydrogenase/reductase SDR [Beutenbergia cavernae DSM 12333]|uniref:Short-chain dehydrogenase/reductase SDR n=1 Tax=Beutenbergia cavernae (strain ATCC BAA-8 / DSM 12333 / CCUG 43141 / JCM 11478 / NBRC 16432 / NCIMB 13614 / HKI 0122) TaxID=471853 RepID=C5BV17_BEUC1|nr:SDR family oxidoreductase [Beutenbergia cavernae]ACQ78391.1 short-chain dehydrogenase/reductase SDR [Beutenbergia cavernae DSM 12333]